MDKRNKELHSRYIEKREKNSKKFNRYFNRVITIVFIGLITIMGIFAYLIRDKDFSVQENRTLANKPEFSIKSFESREFSEDYTSYVSDQFPGRNIFMKLKSSVDELLGKNQINNVYIGQNNQLINRFKSEEEDKTKEKVNAVNDLFERNENLTTSFMLVPTASKVLEEELPKFAPMDNELTYIKNVEDNLNNNITFINPYENLYNNKDKYIYFKTDHHWTTKGAYIGYLTLCNELGLIPKEEDYFTKEKVSDSFYGSLSSKIGVKSGEGDEVEVYYNYDDKVVVNYVEEQRKTTSIFESKALDKKDKYEVFTGGNHPLINIKTMGNPEKKLLIIKDSYANSLLPFLTSHYGEINVVDLRYYCDDIDKLIKDKEVTDLMFLYNVNTFNEDDSILSLSN